MKHSPFIQVVKLFDYLNELQFGLLVSTCWKLLFELCLYQTEWSNESKCLRLLSFPPRGKAWCETALLQKKLPAVFYSLTRFSRPMQRAAFGEMKHFPVNLSIEHLNKFSVQVKVSLFEVYFFRLHLHCSNVRTVFSWCWRLSVAIHQASPFYVNSLRSRNGSATQS